MKILTENGDTLTTENGDALSVDTDLPEILSVNDGNSIFFGQKSVVVTGYHLGDQIFIFDGSPSTMTAQKVIYAFSTLAVFDVVRGELQPGLNFLVVQNSSGTNEVNFPIFLVEESMPTSTVSVDAAETLTSQFLDADKTKDFLSALLSPFDEIDSATQYLNTRASFLYGAVGNWLDSEGQIIGAKREGLEIPESLFFTFGPSRNGGPVAKSFTQGFNGGYLRSRFGNPLAGTVKSDAEYAGYLEAKALATFRGTSLCDLVDFVFELFGIVCYAEFVSMSDIVLTPNTYMTHAQKNVVFKYAPISAGSVLVAIG